MTGGGGESGLTNISKRFKLKKKRPLVGQEGRLIFVEKSLLHLLDRSDPPSHCKHQYEIEVISNLAVFFLVVFFMMSPYTYSLIKMTAEEIFTVTPGEPDGHESEETLTPIEYQLEPIDDIDDIDPKEERAFV